MIHTRAWFIFNGEKSADYDIQVEKAPDIISPSIRSETIVTVGRHGNLHIFEDGYDAYTKTADCLLMGRHWMDYISSWLKGSGKVIFSAEPDKIYDCAIISQISFQKMQVWQEWWRFQAVFEVNPKKKSVNADNDFLIFDKPCIFLGRGNVSSEPIIKIYGFGDMELSINDILVRLKNVDKYLILDCGLKEAYKDGKAANEKMSGEFPRLRPGNNSVSWSGNVDKIEIIPEWSWI